MSLLASAVWDSVWGVILWTLGFFILFAWLILLFQVISDIFSRHISGWAKALWLLFIIIFPIIGTLIYLIVDGSGMARRSAEQAQAQQDATNAYIRNVAGTSTGPADQLKALKEMHDSGQLSDEDYKKAKAKVLD